MKTILLATAAIILLPVVTLAHDHAKASASHASRLHTLPEKKATSNATKEYQNAFAAMHKKICGCYTGDADIDFARGMVPHHQGAIDMAKIELKYGKDPEMRKLAEYILATQTIEVQEMNHWLDRKGALAKKPPVVNSEHPSIPAYKAAMEKMHHDMSISYTGNADVDFARGMIPHHQAAVEMAEIQLKYSRTPELADLSRDIIRSQQQEIRLMQNWLAKQPKLPPVKQSKNTNKKAAKHHH